MDKECNFKLVATFKFGKTPNIDDVRRGGVVSSCIVFEASLLPKLLRGAKDRPFHVCRNGGAHSFRDYQTKFDQLSVICK